MLYYYRADEEATNGTLRTLGDLDRVVVAPGVRLTAIGNDGTIFQLGAANRLDIAGELVASEAVIFSVSLGDNLIRILATGSLNGGSAGVVTSGRRDQVLNAGTITADTGVDLSGISASVVNEGSIYASDLGIGVSRSSGRVVNEGSIFAQLGVNIGANGNVFNGGSIVANGISGTGVRAVGDGMTTVVNSGLIIAQETGILRQVGGPGPAAGSLLLVNTGTIEGNNAVVGDEGDDAIDNAGRIVGDVLLRGGNDRYDGTGGAIVGSVFGGDGDDLLIGGAARDRLLGGGGADSVSGADGNDVLDAGEGNDEVDGGDGDDVLIDGAGEDRYDGGAGRDIVSYRNSNSVIVFLADPSINVGDALGDTYRNIEILEGSAFSDVLNGDDGDNVLRGGAGNDRLTAGAGDDLVIGGDGDDDIRGGAGRDRIIGGAGIDRVSYSGGLEGVEVYLDMQDARNRGGSNIQLISEVESLQGSSFDDRLSGNADDNSIEGGSGIDRIDGFDGNDLLIGGNDRDTLVGGQGADTLDGGNGGDFLYGGSDDDTVSGGGDNDLLDGEAGSDVLNGGLGDDRVDGQEGNDLLDGGDGDDRLIGGDGDDRMLAGVGSDALDGGNGVDTVDFTTASSGIVIDLRLAGGQNTSDGLKDIFRVEQLIGSGFVDQFTGTGIDNRLEGAGGNDLLAGEGGDDTLLGGLGDDLVVGGDGNDSVSGEAGADRLDGGAGNDTANGGDGDDRLLGGLGDDALVGGNGFDLADYSALGARVGVNLSNAAAQNTGAAGFDTLSGIEALLGTRFDDLLVGGVGAETFEGGLGNDTINGGLGIDTVSFAGSGIRVIVSLATTAAQNTGAGIDAISQVENVTGTAFADVITGSTAANLLNGGNGNDRLLGGAGDDLLAGGSGDDLLDAGSGTDRIEGGAGVDTVTYATSTVAISADFRGKFGAVAQTGTVGVDELGDVEALIGSRFADSFRAGAGANRFEGGLGADTFVFDRAAAAGDTVVDFSGKSGQGDRLFLIGYGTGATFTQVSSSAWQVVSGDGSVKETITFANFAAINLAADVVFG